MKTYHAKILIAIITATLLGGCNSDTYSQPTQTNLDPSPIPSATSKPADLFQLTYISHRIDAFDGVYSVDVGCLESEKPCLSEPKLLFEILYEGTPGTPIGYLRWSPDGKYVAICAVGIGGNYDVFVADVNGQNWKNITNSPDYECEPVWSPDGQRLVYLASSYELYQGSRVFSISPLRGEENQLLGLANKNNDVGELSLSSDGKKIAFTSSDNNGYSQIFISELDGSNIVQLTSELANHFTPSFSPDGKWIAFEREFDSETNKSHLIVMKIDDKSENEIGKNLTGTKTWLSWAPFGDWIAFSSYTEGNDEIFIIKKDGSGLTKVTSSNSDELLPEWRILYPDN